MTTGGDRQVNIIWRLRDEVSRKLQGIRGEMQDTGEQAELTASDFGTLGAGLAFLGAGLLAAGVAAARAADDTGVLGRRTEALREQLSELAQTVGRAVLPIMLVFLEVLTNVLQIVNLLPDPLIQIGGSIALIGGGALAAVASIALFIQVMKDLNAILKVNVALQSFLTALGGPLGAARVVGALALTAGVGFGINQIVGSFQAGGVVPGPIGRPALAVVHGGERITPPGGGLGGGVSVVIQAGVFTGDERQARQLVDQVILPRLRENLRVRTGGSL